MTYEEVLQAAKGNLTECAACSICNGIACKGKMPGPGGKGNNRNFIRSFAKLADITINMDTIYSWQEPDMQFAAFGQTFAAPIFAAPIGMLSANFGPKYDDVTYSKELLAGCAAAGLCAFTGDGPAEGLYQEPLKFIKAWGGRGIPTMKTWDVAKMKQRIMLAEAAEAIAIASDIDCVGLTQTPPFSTKTIFELKEVISTTKTPFLLKGVMTAKTAKNALDAGAAGIVVSTHGGRVLADAPAPIEVLPEIAAAVKGKMLIFIDGAIRTGADVFKAIALGADAVLIGRPFTVAVYGAGAQGVCLYAERLRQELSHTMRMAGTMTLADIGKNNVIIH